MTVDTERGGVPDLITQLQIELTETALQVEKYLNMRETVSQEDLEAKVLMWLSDETEYNPPASPPDTVRSEIVKILDAFNDLLEQERRRAAFSKEFLNRLCFRMSRILYAIRVAEDVDRNVSGFFKTLRQLFAKALLNQMRDTLNQE